MGHQERVAGQLVHINPILLAVCQAAADEGLGQINRILLNTALITGSVTGIGSLRFWCRSKAFAFKSQVQGSSLAEEPPIRMSQLGGAPRRVGWHEEDKGGGCKHTFASGDTTGFGANCTSVAFRMVFSCKMSCCD